MNPLLLKKYSPVVFLCVLLASNTVFAQTGEASCGPIANAFGPFDYRTERGNNLNLVESAHFTSTVEALIKGTTGPIGGDLGYTLRAFPNHHRALMSVMRYGEKVKSNNLPGMPYTVECYFDRAIRFKPDDSIVRMIYSMFLNKAGRTADAINQLDIAAASAEDKENAFTHYNLGLNYFDLKDYNKSLIQAQKAYELGFIQPELKNRLEKIGKWTEPTPGTPETAPASDTPK